MLIHAVVCSQKINLKGCQPLSCSESPFYLLTICSETLRTTQCESSLSSNSLGCIKFEIIQHKMYLIATDPSRRGSTSLPSPALPELQKKKKNLGGVYLQPESTYNSSIHQNPSLKSAKPDTGKHPNPGSPGPLSPETSSDQTGS